MVVMPPLRLPGAGSNDVEEGAQVNGQATAASFSDSDDNDEYSDDACVSVDQAGDTSVASLGDEREVEQQQQQPQLQPPQQRLLANFSGGSVRSGHSICSERSSSRRSTQLLSEVEHRARPLPVVQQAMADAAYGRGSSAPALGAQVTSMVDDGQVEQLQNDEQMVEGVVEEVQQQPQEEMVPLSYPSYSWHDTLARFPSLLRLYPLAECSEGAMEDELFHAGNNCEAPSDPGPQTAYTDAGAAAATVPQTEVQTAPHHVEDLPTPIATVHECTGTAMQADNVAVAGHEATWHSGLGSCTPPPCTPVRIGQRALVSPNGTRQGHGGGHPGEWGDGGGHSMQEGWVPSELEAAWAEIEQVREELAQREQDVTQREVAVHRAEARNQASARQLAELRRRLDDYGEELEEGVASLTSQQNALREERRQTLELQARARRMCAAAIRDDVVASKFSQWSRRSWTPSPTMRGM
mmetsp:Transcript_29791/g.57604  ORF Transcript_29791/g.57604 Transcript_29791/m.57604 type:complete len:467 (-) Transcript_29791:109-1509(-)